MDRTGTVHDSIKLSFNVGDIAVTREGLILLLDWANNSVKSVSKDGEFKTLVTSETYPCGICCLTNGNFVVVFADTKQVIEYDDKGEEKRVFDKSLFKRPWFVAENKVNKHLYVCDKSHYSQQTSPGRVLALDAHGELQYTYSGQSSSEFVPMGMCSDSTGNVLITDYKKHRIHLLDKDGRFLQYVLCREHGVVDPYALVVDAHGFTWVCTGNKKQVMVFKYSMSTMG
ncbi:hypothetical protein FSP39_014516 [Pinctada imbricata]|uniref:Tripartite motif-containing protein 2 n=1 Tax=Pinctada imbricata TaxID=66713 RepID=A0AA88YXC7_PINIB|nr:hypothetical protein FSP39_014516 [Pinctada imbricata]